MVEFEVIRAGLPTAGPYSPGVKAGNLLFCSGQVANDPTKDIEGQTREALEKLETLLKAAGAGMEDVARTTVFLTDERFFARMNAEYEAFFKERGVDKFPARSTVGARVPKEGFLVEIDAIAVL
ncbi:MAG: RidA family protein [Promethearchaeota archaeon]